MNRVLVLGNSGSGKSTYAKHLAAERGLVHFDLDVIAFDGTANRRPLEDSVRDLHDFISRNPSFVIEGSYASLIGAASSFADELHFLNIGTEACLENARNRPWEPHKFPSLEAQNEALGFLLDWIASYDHRDDDYGLQAHMEVFEQFPGKKVLHSERPNI